MSRWSVVTLAPRLPRSVWTLHAGMALNTFGSGLTGPFVLIYLHAVRGMGIDTAGLALATHFGAAMAFGLLAGPLVDRFGPRAVATGSLLALAGTLAAFPVVTEPWEAFVLLAAAGVGRGGFWPAYSAWLVALTPQERMHESFAVQRVGGNVALGLGGLAGGAIALTSEPGTFVALFLLNAIASAAFVVCLAFVPSPSRVPSRAGAPPGSGYRAVLRNGPFMAAVAINGVFILAGVAQLNAMLPVFAKTELGVSERWIGAVFFVNTLAIVLVQLPAARAVEGRARMRMLAAAGALWATSWLLVLGAEATAPAAAVALLLVVAVVFGLGEALDGVVSGPLVAELAPQESRGRSMAVWLISAQAGHALGPALGGLLLARSGSLLWGTAAAVCLAAALAAVALERRLPEAARRTPRTAEARPAAV